MKVALLVPRRADHGHRDRLWSVCKARWQRLHPDWDIVEGHHDEGPFNRSAALNTAARLAGDWDVGVVIDSDIVLRPEQAEEAVRTAYETQRVTWGHREWWGMNRGPTMSLLAEPRRLFDPDWKPDESGMKKNPISWSCFIAIPREAWEVIGGFDERFNGWGWEDMAFQTLARGLADRGRHPESRIEGQVFHLWHPRSPGLGKRAHGRDGVISERLGYRYMLALRRDHGLHDRAASADDAEMERDIGNLRRADAKLDRQAARMGLPDWSDWWPTLEELRDHVEPRRGISLVVHSGGSPDAWPDRSEYLRASLGSLDEHIGHEWDRRVIFSDWGEQPELQAIADVYGFEVAGPDRQLGYTLSMREMWKFIRGLSSSFVFLTEDDFTIDRDVDVDLMAGVLEEHPHLVQLALLRAPYYPAEMDPATVLGHPASAFEQRSNGQDTAWLEHSRFFTANPSLIRRSLTDVSWPVSKHSEAVFGRQLFRQRGTRSAFWGSGESWATHIGDTRAGDAY